MINNYPTVYKKLVINKYYNKDCHVNELLERYNISNGSLYNWINKSVKNISLDKQKYTRQSKYTPSIKCFIRAYVLRYKAFKYNNLITLIRKKYNIESSKSSIYRILGKMNIVYKKARRRLIYNKNKINKQRKQFKKTINKISIDDIISIDETSVDNQLYPLYAWGKKGECIEMTRTAVKSRYTIITAISKDKIIHYDIIKNSANALNFKSFLETLETKGIHNKYLLLDNARIHIQYLYLAKNKINFILFAMLK